MAWRLPREGARPRTGTLEAASSAAAAVPKRRRGRKTPDGAAPGQEEEEGPVQGPEQEPDRDVDKMMLLVFKTLSNHSQNLRALLGALLTTFLLPSSSLLAKRQV